MTWERTHPVKAHTLGNSRWSDSGACAQPPVKTKHNAHDEKRCKTSTLYRDLTELDIDDDAPIIQQSGFSESSRGFHF